MIEIGWEQRVFPIAKIALVVEALAAEGVRPQDALRDVGLPPEQLGASTLLVSIDQVIRTYRNAIRLTSNRNFAYQTGLERIQLTPVHILQRRRNWRIPAA